jgi:hypothetical protein
MITPAAWFPGAPQAAARIDETCRCISTSEHDRSHIELRIGLLNSLAAAVSLEDDCYRVGLVAPMTPSPA